MFSLVLTTNEGGTKNEEQLSRRKIRHFKLFKLQEPQRGMYQVKGKRKQVLRSRRQLH